jgi:anaerobic magnesium-protoporphyrin IX monomethyl ester cyclase
MKSVEKRIVFVSHFDIDEKQIDLLNKSKPAAKMFSDLHRWVKVEYGDKLWNEFCLLTHIMDKQPNHFNIWDMPLFSGIYIESLIANLSPETRTLFINNINETNRQAVIEKIDGFKPTHLFLSTTFYLGLGHVHKVLDEFSGFSHIPIVLGGNGIYKELSADLEHDVISDLPKNVYCVNSRYGEREIADILKGEIEKHPDNRIIKHQESEDRNQTAYDPDRWSINFNKVNMNHTLMPIRTSMGCMFNCAFCSYPVVGGGFYEKDIRITLKQLKVLTQKQIKAVHFLDDTLNVPLKRFKLLLKGMLDNDLTNFDVHSFVRCQYLDEETVRQMKQCGWSACLLGIESGSDVILKNMNKNATVEKFQVGINLLKKYDIVTFAAIIVGFPGETEATVQETIDFLNQSGVDFCYVQPFYYLHNSPIHQQRAKYGLSGKGLQWEHNTMNSGECMKMLNEVFFQVTGPIYANEEWAMWEYIYFKFKGYDLEFYKKFRRFINTLRANDIKKYHGIEATYSKMLLEADFLQNVNSAISAPLR